MTADPTTRVGIVRSAVLAPTRSDGSGGGAGPKRKRLPQGGGGRRSADDSTGVEWREFVTARFPTLPLPVVSLVLNTQNSGR